MGNCLLTKMKGVIENNDLPKLGTAKFSFKVSSGMSGLAIKFPLEEITIRTDKATSLSLLGGAVVSTGTIHVFTPADVAHANYSLLPSNVDEVVTVEIDNKYTSIISFGITSSANAKDVNLIDFDYCLALKSFVLRSGSIVNLDAFKANTAITELLIANGAKTTGKLSSLAGNNFTQAFYLSQVDGSGITGSLSDVIPHIGSGVTSFVITNAPNVTGTLAGLATLTSLTNINISGCTNITGNVSDLSPLSLTGITLSYCTGITGNIEDFLEAWYLKGVSNINISLPNGVFFNGGSLGSAASCSASVSNGVLTFKLGSTTKGTYDGTSWTYV